MGDQQYHCLKSREIENLLSPEILKKVIEEFKGEQVKFDFQYKDYENEPLGNFIEQKVGKKKKGGKFSEESGTITEKGKFCDKAISHIKSFNDLTQEAGDLTKKIYAFIKTHNL